MNHKEQSECIYIRGKCKICGGSDFKKPTLTEWLELNRNNSRLEFNDKVYYAIPTDSLLKKIKSGEFRGL
jgi:hypothetical protein